ncbi:MAG: tetratricopeptide repeat protein [Acidobacteria bacterium]|nr:tetratricopeptide repeat protein [Acidobacteriota bacterium]
MSSKATQKASPKSTKYVIGLLSFGLLLCLPGREAGLLNAQATPSADPTPLVIILARLDRGDVAGAERLMSENLPVTKRRLEDIVAEIDQKFDELGRSGATAPHEVHTELLENLLEEIGRYEKLFDMYRRLSDDELLYKRLVARKLRIEGASYTHSGEDACGDHFDWEEAQKLYHLAIERLEAGFALAKEVNDVRLMASAKINMGSTLIRLLQPEQALAAYAEAMRYADQLPGEMYKGLVRLNLGNTYVWIGEPDKALPYSQAALTSFKKMSRGTWEANALMTLGNVYMRQQRFSSAWETLLLALEMAKQSGEDRIHGRILLNLGMAGLQLKKPDAMAFIHDALDWYAHEGADVNPLIEREVVHMDGLRFLSQIARQNGDQEAAEKYDTQFFEYLGSDPERYERLRTSSCFAIYQARPVSPKTPQP